MAPRSESKKHTLHANLPPLFYQNPMTTIRSRAIESTDYRVEWDVIVTGGKNFGYARLGDKELYCVYDRILEVSGTDDFIYTNGDTTIARKDQAVPTINGLSLKEALVPRLKVLLDSLISLPPWRQEFLRTSSYSEHEISDMCEYCGSHSTNDYIEYLRSQTGSL